jgi:hypothetical protein
MCVYTNTHTNRSKVYTHTHTHTPEHSSLLTDTRSEIKLTASTELDVRRRGALCAAASEAKVSMLHLYSTPCVCERVRVY